jgi:hypothetical protein
MAGANPVAFPIHGLSFGDPTTGAMTVVSNANPLPTTSSGGGGGGAVTIADGADVTLGAKADAAVVGDNSGTVSAKLRGLNKIFNDVWVSASHWLSVSDSASAATGAAVPANAAYLGVNVGGNLTGATGVTVNSRTCQAVTGNGTVQTADFTIQGRQPDPTVIAVSGTGATASVGAQGMGTMLIAMSASAISGLTFTFQGAPDPSSTVDGSATWYTLQGAQTGANKVQTGLTTAGTGNLAWMVDCVGMNRVRVNVTALGSQTGLQFSFTPIMPALRACPTVQTNSAASTSFDLATVAGSAIALGQAAMAASLPVVVASNQSNLPTNIVQVAGGNSANAGQTGALQVGGATATNTNVSSATNPLLLAGSDYGGTPKVQSLKVDSSGNAQANITQYGGTAVVTGGVNGTVGVGGLAASGAALAGNPVLVAGSDGTNARNLATDSTGHLVLSALPAGTNSIGAVTPAAATTGGGTPGRYLAAASANQDSQNIKSSAGTLYSICIFNTATAIRYLKLYNNTSPTSSSTPVMTIALPGFTTGSGAVICPAVGIAFSTAIAFRMTTGQGDSDASAVTAGDLVFSYVYI